MRKKPSVAQLIEGITAGKTVALSRGITLLESQNANDRKQANELLRAFGAGSPKSLRIGITGVPGVGKSTFIEAFGKVVTEQGKKMAVLAIDPTSQATKGSIMGDKTRMEELVNNPNVYIRPSPSGSTLGGVASKTREAILLCEAAGFEVVLVETVGVGQSETAVKGMVDAFILLMLANAGDELQGIKKGIMEMADFIIINKAEGSNQEAAKKAKRAYLNALHLFRPRSSGWFPKVLTASALQQEGIIEIWEGLRSFFEFHYERGLVVAERKRQNRKWLRELLEEEILLKFYQNETVSSKLHKMEDLVMAGSIPVREAVSSLLEGEKWGGDA